MPRRKRKPRLCCNEVDAGCNISLSLPPAKKTGRTNRKIYELFDEQGVVVDRDEQDRFVDFLERSERQRDVVKQLWTRLKNDDIISLILSARDADDLDEAIWRSFLAAHFGRPSANRAVENQVESAAMLLCGFGTEPKWTWDEVRTDQRLFRNWLYDHADDLQSLSFGNHRKYESQQPDLLWEVIESFIDLAKGIRRTTGSLDARHRRRFERSVPHALSTVV